MRTSKNKIQRSKPLVSLIEDIRQLVLSARTLAARTVDTLQVLTNFHIGQRIVEHEQSGAKRAAYGQKVLKELSLHLTGEFGRGFSEDNLSLMRKFYLTYCGRKAISETVSRKLIESSPTPLLADCLAISETASRKSGKSPLPQILKGQTASDLSSPSQIVIKTPASPFTLSWSHYVFLMGINNPDERRFYEIEATENNWSLRELKRQFDSGLYERLALSRDKKGIRKLARKGHVVDNPQDLFKNPYVLEFLGLDEKSGYSESDLENAIIDKLEHFLLELGKGFLFESRQKRFTFDEEHFFVDLVFYNRLLRCYVLFDLKIGKLTHQDLGQMQMYVNYFDRFVKQKNENPTVGIILCRKKKDALVEMTLPKTANIRASEYQLYLPSKAELKQKLLDWTNEQEPR